MAKRKIKHKHKDKTYELTLNTDCSDTSLLELIKEHFPEPYKTVYSNPLTICKALRALGRVDKTDTCLYKNPKGSESYWFRISVDIPEGGSVQIPVGKTVKVPLKTPKLNKKMAQRAKKIQFEMDEPLEGISVVGTALVPDEGQAYVELSADTTQTLQGTKGNLIFDGIITEQRGKGAGARQTIQRLVFITPAAPFEIIE